MTFDKNGAIFLIQIRNMDTINITQLEEQYLKAKVAYYQGEPFMSDASFDALEAVLKGHNSKVVNVVGYTVSNDSGLKFEHITPMKSLEKVTSEQGGLAPIDKIKDKLHDWIKQLDNWSDSLFITIEPKFDGNACKVVYKNGKLFRALTRGDGYVGIDITDKIKHIVPNEIETDEEIIEVTGEIVIKKATFNELYSSKYKNPRNFVAGKLNKDYTKLSPEQLKEEVSTVSLFTFVAFDISTESEFVFTKLLRLGFSTIDTDDYFYHCVKNVPIDNSFVWNVYQHFKNMMLTHKFLLDGFVVKIDNKELREKFGELEHHPKWAFAVKFESQEAITQIESISWTIGTNNNLTPVANLVPVELNGTMVSRVSLYNYSYIVEKKAYPTAWVSLIKSGEIIPRIVDIVNPAENLEEYELDPLRIITNFSNIEPNEILISDKHAVFTGDSRYSDIKKLHKGVVALGIPNIGPAMAEKLYDSGIKQIENLFDPERFNSFSLVFEGEFKNGKELDTIVESVSSVPSVSLAQIIESCQFIGCGTTMSKQLANYFTGIGHDFTGLERSVISRITEPNSVERQRILKLIQLLEDSGIKVIYPKEPSTETKTFEMTGTPPNNPKFKTKSDYESYAKLYGWTHSSLNQKTDLLVTDSHDSNSTKMKKARKYGTKIVNYDEFLELLK